MVRLFVFILLLAACGSEGPTIQPSYSQDMNETDMASDLNGVSQDMTLETDEGSGPDQSDQGIEPVPDPDPQPDPEPQPDPDPEPDPNPEPNPEPTGARVFWLAPTGVDSNPGTESAPMLTLGRVQEVLKSEQPDRDVIVNIKPGTYRGQTVVWNYTHPTHTIRFTRPTSADERPIFDGCLTTSNCPGGTWFQLRHSAGQETNLDFNYIRVRNYTTAISLNGDRNAEANSNGSNRIFGCYFERIGNIFNANAPPSTAALRLVNSDDNLIRNNHFIDVVNLSNGGLIHAIYAAHMSDRNRIESNRFKNSTGDPVRLRDFSNYNVITANQFTKVGVWGGYTDWYCDHDVRTDCTKVGPECPSWQNQFRDNTLDGNWTCGTLGTFHYFQGDTTTGCSKPEASAVRLRTSGNTQTPTTCSL